MFFWNVFLDVFGEELPLEWTCSSTSTAHVLRIESLVCILDVAKSEEHDHGMNITLTKESAEALTKVEDVELWTVGHTMVRGSNRALGGSGNVDFSGQKKSGTVPKPKAKRKRKVEEVEEQQEPMNADLFRRSAPGRAAIQRALDEINVKDQAMFQKTPMFDLEGKCRLKLEGASQFSWDALREAAPEMLECMYFGKDKFFYVFLSYFKSILFIYCGITIYYYLIESESEVALATKWDHVCTCTAFNVHVIL